MINTSWDTRSPRILYPLKVTTAKALCYFAYMFVRHKDVDVDSSTI